MDKFSFCKEIKKRRIDRGWSQTEVSQWLYMDRPNYNRFEQGKRGLTVEQLKKLAIHMKIPFPMLSAMQRLDGIDRDELSQLHALSVVLLMSNIEGQKL